MGQSQGCHFNCYKGGIPEQPTATTVPSVVSEPMPSPDPATKVLNKIMEESRKSTRNVPVQPYWVKKPQLNIELEEPPEINNDSILNRQERRLLNSIETTPQAKMYAKRFHHFDLFDAPEHYDDDHSNNRHHEVKPSLFQIPESALLGSDRDAGNRSRLNPVSSNRDLRMPNRQHGSLVHSLNYEVPANAFKRRSDAPGLYSSVQEVMKPSLTNSYQNITDTNHFAARPVGEFENKSSGSKSTKEDKTPIEHALFPAD